MKHLLLLHGALGSSTQLDPLRAALSDSFQTHTLNFQGHGGAPLMGVPSMALFIQQVVDFAKDLDQEFSIFGYSMGGYAALWACAYTRHIDKVMTLGTKFDWNPLTASRELQMLQPDVMEAKIPEFVEMLASMHAPLSWREVIENTRIVMTELGNKPILDAPALRAISQQIWILVGDRDTTAGVEASRMAAMILPNAHFEVLSNTSHPLEKTNPVALADRIRKSLS